MRNCSREIEWENDLAYLKRKHPYFGKVLAALREVNTLEDYNEIRQHTIGKYNGLPWLWWNFVVLKGRRPLE